VRRGGAEADHGRRRDCPVRDGCTGRDAAVRLGWKIQGLFHEKGFLKEGKEGGEGGRGAAGLAEGLYRARGD